MQWAAQFVANHEPLGERPTVVSTTGTEREEIASAAHQDHVLAGNLALQDSAVAEAVNRDTGAQICAFSTFDLHVRAQCESCDRPA